MSVLYRIGLLPGDGVGPEVVAEAQKAVDATGLSIDWVQLPWGSDYWLEHGRMMPNDALSVAGELDAVLMGAVGDPRVPDHVSLWGLLLELRQRLDLWANVRPVRLLPGIPSALRADVRPHHIDMIFVRENTEGEYAGVGGRAHRGLPHDIALDVSIFSRTAVERVIRYAFTLAESRRRVLTSATKSNASRHAYVFWDEITAQVAEEFPDVTYERVLVDALAARMVQNPASLDVIVASNLFADILTDLGAAIQGGMGMAASANIAPAANTPGLFEPVHGSAPDIAGKGIANPCGAIWSAALMLQHLGEVEQGQRILSALERVCESGPRTRDVGGASKTTEVGDAIAAAAADARA